MKRRFKIKKRPSGKIALDPKTLKDELERRAADKLKRELERRAADKKLKRELERLRAENARLREAVNLAADWIGNYAAWIRRAVGLPWRMQSENR